MMGQQQQIQQMQQIQPQQMMGQQQQIQQMQPQQMMGGMPQQRIIYYWEFHVTETWSLLNSLKLADFPVISPYIHEKSPRSISCFVISRNAQSGWVKLGSKMRGICDLYFLTYKLRRWGRLWYRCSKYGKTDQYMWVWCMCRNYSELWFQYPIVCYICSVHYKSCF